MNRAGNKPPVWVRYAARRSAGILYRELERIDGEEMNDSQLVQDANVGRDTWMRQVTAIIERVFHESMERRK
jgi:hypothetical protein